MGGLGVTPFDEEEIDEALSHCDRDLAVADRATAEGLVDAALEYLYDLRIRLERLDNSPLDGEQWARKEALWRWRKDARYRLARGVYFGELSSENEREAP